MKESIDSTPRALQSLTSGTQLVKKAGLVFIILFNLTCCSNSERLNSQIEFVLENGEKVIGDNQDICEIKETDYKIEVVFCDGFKHLQVLRCVELREIVLQFDQKSIVALPMDIFQAEFPSTGFSVISNLDGTYSIEGNRVTIFILPERIDELLD